MTEDWSPLGAPGDLSGDVAAIATTRRQHEVLADTFAADRDALARIRPDELWLGRAASRFAGARDRLLDGLEALAARSRAVVAALWSWAHVVEDTQARGRHARDRARDAVGDLEHACGAQGDVDPRVVADARARLEQARRDFAAAVDDHRRMARVTADRIREAAVDDLDDAPWALGPVTSLVAAVVAGPTSVRFRVTASGLELDKPRPDLRDVLFDNQTPDDPTGVGTWGPRPGGIPVGAPRYMTIREAEALHGMRHVDVAVMWHVHRIAMTAAHARFPVGGHDPERPSNDDHQDAFRHAYWAALIARRFGQGFARWFTTVHEGIPGNSREREAMDLHNNGVGLDVQAAHPDANDERLADLVHKALSSGRLVVITGREELAWTDDVTPDEAIDLEDEDEDLRGFEPGHVTVPRVSPDFFGPERHVRDILP